MSMQQNHNDYDELVDLVDEHDRIVGFAYRRDIEAKKLAHVRIVIAIVKNHEGRFLVPRRAWHKSCGGV